MNEGSLVFGLHAVRALLQQRPERESRVGNPPGHNDIGALV